MDRRQRNKKAGRERQGKTREGGGEEDDGGSVLGFGGGVSVGLLPSRGTACRFHPSHHISSCLGYALISIDGSIILLHLATSPRLTYPHHLSHRSKLVSTGRLAD